MNNQIHIRVLRVDDHPLLNEGIASLINNQTDMQLIAQATSGTDAIEKFRGYRPCAAASSNWEKGNARKGTTSRADSLTAAAGLRENRNLTVL